MAKWLSGSPPKSEQGSQYYTTIAIHRDHFDFLSALWRICRDEQGPPLDRNPVQTLLTKRAEEWRRVSDRVRAKYSQPGTRWFYGESSELHDELNTIVRAWASEFLLVCDGQPATWIVDDARRVLNGDQFRYQPIGEPQPEFPRSSPRHRRFFRAATQVREIGLSENAFWKRPKILKVNVKTSDAERQQAYPKKHRGDRLELAPLWTMPH